ncbi:hypothetical protein ABE10_00900, partial [Bacillus toyonensis]|nr:hypothetical protein [Bacillus toyonensis]
EAQELVIERRALPLGGQEGEVVGLCAEHAQHPLVLVAERELHRSVLHGLESRGVAERSAELRVLGGGERRQDRPLLGQHLLDVLDAGDVLERRTQVVLRETAPCGAELVQHELEPKLRRLVLDDEQQLVVVLGDAHRML